MSRDIRNSKSAKNILYHVYFTIQLAMENVTKCLFLMVAVHLGYVQLLSSKVTACIDFAIERTGWLATA